MRAQRHLAGDTFKSAHRRITYTSSVNSRSKCTTLAVSDCSCADRACTGLNGSYGDAPTDNSRKPHQCITCELNTAPHRMIIIPGAHKALTRWTVHDPPTTVLNGEPFKTVHRKLTGASKFEPHQRLRPEQQESTHWCVVSGMTTSCCRRTIANRSLLEHQMIMKIHLTTDSLVTWNEPDHHRECENRPNGESFETMHLTHRPYKRTETDKNQTNERTDQTNQLFVQTVQLPRTAKKISMIQ